SFHGATKAITKRDPKPMRSMPSSCLYSPGGRIGGDAGSRGWVGGLCRHLGHRIGVQLELGHPACDDESGDRRAFGNDLAVGETLDLRHGVGLLVLLELDLQR